MESIEIKELFNKYIRRECSEEEVQQIVAYFQKSKDFSGVPTIEEVSKLLEAYPDMEEAAANRIYNNILETNKKKQPSIKRIFPILRYVAAAVLIGILATAYLFQDDINNSPQVKPSTIVDSNIVPGTDKATLTLEDGSVLVLEKGSTVQTQKANSNGEKIVYKSGEGNVAKVVYNYLTIPRGGQFNIVLSDGTEVWLNSETQLKYPVNFVKGQTREVELVYGEAYFDVSPSTVHGGSTFKVINNAQEVEVLGTEFNIKAYKDETNVYTTLVEGKVAVGNGKTIQNLKPNQQSNFDVRNGTIQIKEVDVYEQISWKDGVFSFRSKPLKEIMKVLSRWYDVDIIFENTELESLEFIGSLDKDQNIEEILSIMKSSTINNYEIKGNKIIILK
ncbi:FecR family protein [Confluentibacter flavum]|uniref:Anti-sigma factor n=2 Tax=Confluentibacter flavum TaxID=1909700 RepID=A0A2N3HGS6_9FLAO|nr:FecR family protein [Confluentibacter flavum]PKQ44166.1 anti-sigma factor [Confluentibacter flavum]PKQ44627.1 anti-sigma factor [Confluentibacter flavum]PKQ44650.1 anti-sigma factor [Confluentibacter flavum]